MVLLENTAILIRQMLLQHGLLWASKLPSGGQAPMCDFVFNIAVCKLKLFCGKKKKEKKR